MDLTQEWANASGATPVDAAGPAGNIASRSRMTTNSSLIGFKGAESLGNGMTAVFQAEFGINGDTGGWAANSGNAFGQAGARDTYVGVAGGFGTVAMGTLTHPIREMGAKVDFNPGASSAGFTGSMYGEVLGVKTGSDDRATNAVAYITPTFNGFSGVLAYVNGESSLNSAQNTNVSIKGTAWQIAGKYENGPLYVGLGYDKHTDPQVMGAVWSNATGTTTANAAFGATNDSLKITRLAAKYAFPTATTVSFLWDKQTYTTTNNAAAAKNFDASRSAYMLGANQNFGASNVYLQYAVARDPSGSACGAILCGDFGAKQWTLGYSYDLSKRTMIHALYSKITNDKSAAYDHYVGAVGIVGNSGAGVAGTNQGADTSVWGVGLRHTF